MPFQSFTDCPRAILRKLPTCFPLRNNTRKSFKPGKRSGDFPPLPLSFPPMNNETPTPAVPVPFQVNGYVLTPAQSVALLALTVRWNIPLPELLSGAYPEIGNPATACLMVPIPGRSIVLGIERDGYTHS